MASGESFDILGAASDTHQTRRAPSSTIDDQIYHGHPEEQRVITDLVAPILGNRAALQYEAG
jgi:hypothetical protein